LKREREREREGEKIVSNGRKRMEERKEINVYYDFLCKEICSRDVTCVGCEQKNKILLSQVH
jgi:hypothetical protein